MTHICKKKVIYKYITPEKVKIYFLRKSPRRILPEDSRIRL